MERAQSELGSGIVWASPIAILWFMYVLQHRAKGLSEVEKRSTSVVVNKYTFSVSFKIAEPIIVKHDNSASDRQMEGVRVG